MGNTVEETRIRIEERRRVLEMEQGGDGLERGVDEEEEEEQEEEEYHKLTWEECEMILDQVRPGESRATS